MNYVYDNTVKGYWYRSMFSDLLACSLSNRKNVSFIFFKNKFKLHAMDLL